jgi:hypothetical protein
MTAPSLHENVVRLAGSSCTVPFVSVSVAVLNFVASVIETALRSTLVVAGSVAGPLKADVPGLAVLMGFIVPHPGVQSDPFWVRVQFNPWPVGSLLTVAVNCGIPVIGTIPLGGLIAETAMAGTVTVTCEEFAGLVTEVAITETLRSLEGRGGAVYVTEPGLSVEAGDTLPHSVAEQTTLQVTPALAGSFVTVTVNCMLLVASRGSGLCGSTSTTIAGTVTKALAAALELATAVAVIVTCKSLAGGAGAVYVVGTPLRLDDDEVLPHGAVGHETAQLTPWLVLSFTRVAVNATLFVPSTVAAAGATVIPIEGMSRLAEADLLLSVVEVAVTITVVSLVGGVAGAV